MNAGWKTKTVGEVCTLKSGTTVSKDKEKTSGDLPYLKVADMTHSGNENEIVSSSRFLNKPDIGRNSVLPPGTTIFPKRGGAILTNKKRLTAVPICADLNIMGVIPGKSLLPEFLYYYFLNIDMRRLGSGSSIPQINNYDIEPLVISFPETEKQQRIIRILDEAFENIATAKTNAEKNLQNTRDIFKSLLNSVFTQQGEGWLEKPLGEVCDNLDSKRVPITKKKRIAGEYPYYGASGVVDHVEDYIFDEDLLLVSEDGANLLARTYPIAFSVSGKVWVNNHAHVLRFINLAAQRFVEYYLNSIKLENYVSGMAQPKLNQKSLNSIPVPNPSLPKKREVVQQLDTLREETQRLESIYQRKVADFDALKKSLLHQAFTGKL